MYWIDIFWSLEVPDDVDINQLVNPSSLWSPIGADIYLNSFYNQNLKPHQMLLYMSQWCIARNSSWQLSWKWGMIQKHED